MRNDFYSDKNQLRRELCRRWHSLNRGDLFCGTIIALLSFYALNWPGYSQVYDVLIPYLVAALHLTVLIFTQTHAERTGRTAAFYVNLPRERVCTYLATAKFFLGYALYLQLIIALGVFLKLGDAGITPIYRLHPEMVALPFVAVFFCLWYCHRPRNGMEFYASVTALSLFAVGLIVRYLFKPGATPENNFLPPRDLSLSLEWAIALLVLSVGAIVCWRLRGEHPSEKGAGA